MERVIFRIETESRDVAVQNHLRRLEKIEDGIWRLRGAILQGQYPDAPGNPMEQVEHLLNEKIKEMADDMPAQRRLIVFGHQINLPPKKYS